MAGSCPSRSRRPVSAHDSSSYVQSGLIAQWDGIENVGVGRHDSEAKVWKDLKGSYDLTIRQRTNNIGGEWGETYLDVAGSSAVGASAAPAYRTIEVVYRMTSKSTYNILFCSGSSRRWVLFDSNGTKAYFDGGNVNTPYVPFTFSADANRFIGALYNENNAVTNVFNGGISLANPSTCKDNWGTGDGKIMLGDRATSGSNYKWYGRIYAIRLYDRALTDEERLANARVDSMRFHIDTMDDRLDIATESSCAGIPLSPDYAGRSGLEADQEVAVSAGNVNTENVRAFCTGWKLFDSDGGLVDSGTDTSFTYRHPNPAAYRRLEWQYAVSNLVTISGAGATYNPAAQWVKKGERAEFTFTTDEGKVFHSVSGDPEATVTGSKLTTGPVMEPLALTMTYAQQLFVDAEGDDDNGTGTAADPFASVARALTELNGNPGVITVNKGDYPLTAGISVTTDVKIRGATGKPEDVRFYRQANNFRFFLLNHASASVENCTIEGGVSGSAGVGVYIDSNGGQVINCIVRNHKLDAHHGASVAIYGNTSKAVVSRCVITNNTTTVYDYNYAAAVYLGAGRIDNSLIAYLKHTSTPMAGGALVLDGSAVAEHCTVYGNNCYSAAGLVLVSNAKAVNCLVFGNVTQGSWAEGTCWSVKNTQLNVSGKTANFINCIFDKYTPNTDTCRAAGVEVLTAEPAKHDFRLTPGSKAVDFGTDANCVSTLDLAGNPRSSGAARDVGCYELQQDGFVVGFKADKREGLVPTEVKFTAVTFGAPEGDSITYKWDFDNDGTYDETTTEPSVQHTYETAGTYAVKLLAISTAMGEKSFEYPSFFVAAAPCVYVVKGNPKAAAPYVTWETAAANVPEAVAVAGNGTEVVISNGTYQITSTIALTHAITLRGASGRPEDVIIDAQDKCRVLKLSNDAEEYVRDLTIAKGRLWDNYAHGPAVAIMGGGVLSNCIVRGCYQGGQHAASMAVYCISSRGLITHCVITNNTSGNYNNNFSAAAYLLAGRISNSLIGWNKHNDSNLKRGGMLTLDGSAVAENCTVVKNSSQVISGINLASATAKAKNCVVAANASSGTRVEDCCWGVVRADGTAVGNTANYINCVFDLYTPNTDTCYAGSGLTFVNAADGDFHPKMGSKAVDFGTDDITDEPNVDLDGLTRRCNDKIDAGCWEFQAAAFEAGFTGDTSGSFAPWRVNCEALVSGADDDDELAYYWDFDNDGVFDVTTSVKTVTYTYRSTGVYDASLMVTNLTKGGAATELAVNEKFFKANPKMLYVVSGNEGAQEPYDTWTTAASDIQTAVSFAAEGAEVVVSNGTYDITSQIAVTVPITLRGLTGRPEDVIVDAQNKCRALDVNAGTNAFVHSLTLRNGNVNDANGGGINIHDKGGSVSNLVVARCTTQGKWAVGTLYCENADCSISHCVVTNCVCATGSDGGHVSGIIHLSGSSKADHCIVSGGGYKAPYFTGHYNAAMVIANGSAEWCTVVSNTMHAVGGINVTGTGAFRYCLIAGNKSVYKPDSPRHQVWGALDTYPVSYADFDDNPRATTATILARQQTNVSDRVQINDTCLYAEGGLVSLLPKFERRGRFTQGPNSPGLDVVPPSAAPAMPATDVFGNPRKIGPGCDLGAVEAKVGGLLLLVR